MREWRARAPHLGLVLFGLALATSAPAPPPASAETRLPPSPFVLDLTPAAPAAGSEAVVRLDRAGAGPETAAMFDIYLVRVPSGPPFLRYFWPTGVWSEAPAPWARRVFLPRFAPLRAHWREEGPAGWISLLVVFPRSGADPGDRVNWVFQPLLRRVRVRAEAPLGWRAALAPFVPLGLATLAASVAVMLFPRSRGRAR